LKFVGLNRFLLGCILGWLLFGPAAAPGAETDEKGPSQQDTMLMFVGEDLDVLSIASRRKESAWQAPAVAEVVTRDEIHQRGIHTLSRALDMLPGFYMAEKESGTQPYLRGIRDSVLFLYDAVPMNADMRKSTHPLDNNLSMASVKRIEIVRGPGSVLWGPDAFAGIVNVVPLTGKDLDGAEAGLLYGEPGGQVYGYGNLGYDGGVWDAFLSVSGRRGEEDDTRINLLRFFGDGVPPPVPPEERLGEAYAGTARYLEVSGNVSFRDWFTLSGRYADYKRPYAITRAEEDLTWQESRSEPMSYLKMEGKKALDATSALQFMGYYSRLDAEYEIIDLAFTPRESTFYGEAVYDRSFLAGRGLFTGGASYRNRKVRDAPVWGSYLPDFLGDDNTVFLPTLVLVDYKDRLGSAFGQYTHKIGDFDLIFGLRYDNHSSYEDHVSYSAGSVWSPSPRWAVKLLLGNAYRTPFSRQLLEGSPIFLQPSGGGKPDLERIRTLSAQANWKPSKRWDLSICGFFSQLDNHINQDPYAGLSLPNEQDIKGVELEGRFAPLDNLEFSANLTLLHNDGPDEKYVYVAYYKVDPEGNLVPVYDTATYPYDIGADTLFNFTATWRPVDRITTFLRVRYFSSRVLIYPRAEGDGFETIRSSSGAWLVDLVATVKDIWRPGLDLELAVRNLTDNEYDTPGAYTTITGAPVSATAMLRMRW